ncbi:MAG: FadR/GntR family transcriptional regulator [Terriglobales bacterium]|jgi:GntR family transcriptional repressor for pyruvate dehydrogenase complex
MDRELSPNATNVKPLSRATLSELVAKEIAGKITAGEWKPGSKLPSEAELCRAFGVGRSCLREALTSLSFIGLVRARAGEGSFVADQPSVYLTNSWLNRGLLTTERELNEFAEARLVLETEMAALCASRSTETELKNLEGIVEQMNDSIDDARKFRDLDLAFHLAMGAAARNDVLNDLLTSVRERMSELIEKSLLLRQGMKQAASQHARILEAFRSRNPEKARSAMDAHLRSFQRGYKVLFEAGHRGEISKKT